MNETQLRTALEEKFAQRIGECFLGACDRLAEERKIPVDTLIESLFSRDGDLDDGLCHWIGESVETFEERVNKDLDDNQSSN